jgi:hypothetical protein
MTRTSRNNEIMILSDKGLYFGMVIESCEGGLFEVCLNEEQYFVDKHVRGAIGYSKDNILVCIDEDPNAYIIDRTIQSISKTI